MARYPIQKRGEIVDDVGRDFGCYIKEIKALRELWGA